MLFAENPTLQAGVHGDQFGSLAQDFEMYRLSLAHEIAGRLGLPAWVATGVHDFCPSVGQDQIPARTS
jgi:hypothetical protein